MNRMVSYLLSTALCLAVFLPATAQEISVEVESPGCLPVAENGVVTANVDGEPPGSTVRIYFRRMHEEVEDFYYVLATPTAPGVYKAVLPEAEDEELEDKELESAPPDNDEDDEWADWWKAKLEDPDRDPNDDLDRSVIEERARFGRRISRDWMLAMSDQELQEFLERQENEPAEYYGAIVDASGTIVATSDLEVVEVRPRCSFPLTARQQGEAENLVIGHTNEWQEGEVPFHWLCDGIVSRIYVDGVLHIDRDCRFCVIAWWQKKGVLIPAAAAAIATGVIIADNDDQPASPSGP